MEKLEKAYQAIDQLESIGFPITPELKVVIARFEREYLREEVIPLIEQEMAPLLEKMRNSFELEITYNPEDALNITLVDRPKVQPQLFAEEQPSKRQKKYIIRVIFPDNHVSCKHMVWETLMDVIRFAGPENVQRLGINIMGGNLVSRQLHENERYRVGQKEVEPGLYVCTYSSTDTKLEQIKTINRALNLGLKIEKQML